MVQVISSKKKKKRGKKGSSSGLKEVATQNSLLNPSVNVTFSKEPRHVKISLFLEAFNSMVP